MCGIVGVLGPGSNFLLSAMSDAIAHRGPDGSGLWVDDAANIALGHRRLAIIDLCAAAAQPMSGVGGRYQVVFNGEIYNFVALAAELRARGCSFNQFSDTAILAPLYDLYGAAILFSSCRSESGRCASVVYLQLIIDPSKDQSAVNVHFQPIFPCLMI
jgi:asparagine synthase (glutamine-hydrolysing)